ncbi:uncharacterized protein N7482_009579 [Penicillium canariense]|uniref:Uncharacterized protein n=1 Tax=Penicillium canariense TaxID=189055 RepID=A0A9W9HP39_9EURO|nr:uncharacterized protein N7482_009579 [Penicillium canariense]KAJ5153101.1 hypothetical protein N7482_009579 [Penicillium canariense]
MPPPVTPSPFRLTRRDPTRRSAGPQFANSPRFLLSQSTPQESKDDVDIVDDDAPPSTGPAARTPAQPRHVVPPPRRPRDVIEDYHDGEWLGNTEARNNEAMSPGDFAIDSSPLDDSGTPVGPDTEFDTLFTPTENGKKRQRLSAGEGQTLDQKSNRQSEERQSSSPEPRRPTFDPLHTPAPRLAQRPPAQNLAAQATPGIPAKPGDAGVGIPGSTKTPFRSRPRFMLSTQKPRSQPPFRAETPSATQSTPPQERRKPTFVLPRSPSPNEASDNIPAPFSPSSRTLHRRGRPRSSVAGYVPGGMAAEVRSWILEVGSKREQAVINPAPVESNGSRVVDLTRYLLAARIVQVKPAGLKSAGALSFVLAEPVNNFPTGDEEPEILKIMIMGPPRSRPAPHATLSRARIPQPGFIHEGDLLGIYRDLAWHVTFGEFQALSVANGLQTEPFQNCASGSPERWLIVMEWDLVEAAT